jgi:hypothetical protein
MDALTDHRTFKIPQTLLSPGISGCQYC